MRIAFVFLVLMSATHKMNCQTWLPLDKGIGGCLSGHHIHSLFYDTTTALLHVSGHFRTEGNCVTVNGFAKWNGQQFDSSATNLPMSSAYLQITYLDKIYGSRRFSEMNDPGIYLGYIEDEQWTPIEGSPDALIEVALVNNGLLYLGGGFDHCGGGNCYMLCTYNGETFIPLITEGYDGGAWRIQDITFYQGQLIAGGRYELLDDQGASVWHLGIASNGWMNAFDPPMTASSNVEALQVWGDDLYIGGLLTPEGASNYRSIVKWDGTSFNDLSTFDYGDIHGPVNERITDLELYNDKLYIAGWFDQLEGQPCQGVACWDGVNWECLNTQTISNLWSGVSDIEIINDTLYMAGDFTTIGGDTLHCIAKLNQSLTNISEIAEEVEISIYPNPASHELTIECSTHFEKVEIIDITGRIVSSIPSNHTRRTIRVDHLSKGCYFITMKFGDGRLITRRFVKK